MQRLTLCIQQGTSAFTESLTRATIRYRRLGGYVMSTQFEIFEAEVLKLVSADRALLAEHLIASLNKIYGMVNCYCVIRTGRFIFLYSTQTFRSQT
jgi:hypothetical protein